MSRTTPPADREQRQLIAEELGRTMLVEAAAGTGKTTSMLDRMVSLLRHGVCRIDTMAAVTFTRKAAAELRSRFQLALERAAHEAEGQEKERLLEALSRVERCFIGTIHAFCARLLRERPIEAGVDLSFQEIEPEEDMQLRGMAWSDYVSGLYAQDDPLLVELTDRGLEIGELYNTFLEYANFPDVDDWPAPDVDLGDLAAVRSQLQSYIKHMRQLAPTFPADRGSDKLMATYELIVRLARNRDLDETAQLFEVLQEFKASKKCTQKYWPGGQPQGKVERDRWRDFSERFAEPLAERWLEKRYATVMHVLAGAVRVYDELRSSLGRLNYQDLLMKAADLLRDNPQIRGYFRRRFTHLLVDEFQDTDPVQAEVVMYLTASDFNEQDWQQCRPVAGSLFVVGDPKQSIYRFRRADIVTYSQVKSVIQASGGLVVPLTSNFRTLGELVGWGNRLFAKHFPAKATIYSPAVSPMDVGRLEGSDGELSGIRTLTIPAQHNTKESAIQYEADFIGRYIHHALDTGMTVPRTPAEIAAGVSREAQPGDFLIVTWGKKQLFEYGRSLQELRIPHEVSGSSALSQVDELTMLLDCLRALSEPENPVALVAVLRGPLFGISDAELYAYKKAGGRFSYRARLPESLGDTVAALFHDAFERLGRYHTWLRRLPPVSAVERITFDLGLPMHALSTPGESVRAGSIAKAFQLLRAAQSEFYSIEELAAYLEALIDERAEFDGLPVRPYERSVVWVMNLHKVKGLEAPVVFLANPTGRWDPPVSLHVDRVGNKVKGYIAVHEGRGRRSPQFLAKPPAWEALAEEERRFEAAEDLRLRYVAATRAGTQLTIVQHADSKANIRSYWEFFQPYLESATSLADPGAPSLAATERLQVESEDIQNAVQEINQRWQACNQPSYATVAAKEVAVSAAGLHRGATTGEHGTEWGTVIHFLLETAMREPTADLRDLAYAALEEQGLEGSRAHEVVNTVTKVVKSKVWQRAQASDRVLAEVPFQRCSIPAAPEQDVPTVLRGVIDLVFREGSGWVIVDYKTDAAAEKEQGKLVEHYRGQVELYAAAWEEMIGEPVSEKGLFFTASEAYVVV